VRHVADVIVDEGFLHADEALEPGGVARRLHPQHPAFVEFCVSLPATAMRTAGEPKAMLKRLLARYVPRTLTDRPKQGFGVPLRDWLRGPLRIWASDLLAAERLTRDGYLQPRAVGEKLQAHLNGDADWSALLWDVLMFQGWLDARRQSGSSG
ncbi:MAG: hypothetical protein HC809_06795, partial [Gammaproteobacteria bacterium]|nr:hypothetical protein [Gammaproteobacteria bacterium]